VVRPIILKKICNTQKKFSNGALPRKYYVVYFQPNIKEIKLSKISVVHGLGNMIDLQPHPEQIFKKF
jgi:hypothetical protein